MVCVGEHSGVDNGHEDHGNVTAAHDTGAHDAAHKSFDKQMLRFAISGLSDGHGEESHSVHDDHGEGNEHGHEGGHEEYHPIEFFHYVPKCCGKASDSVL